jgi:hypothetical protein
MMQQMAGVLKEVISIKDEFLARMKGKKRLFGISESLGNK